MATPSAAVVAGVALAALLQAAFHLAVARILGPSEYSLLAAMLTLVLIATPAAVSLQAAMAREVAWRLEREDGAAAGIVLRDTLWALTRRVTALLVVFFPLGVVAAIVTGVRHPLPVFATLITIAAMLALSVTLGGLEGSGRPALAGALQCFFAGLKLSVGIGFALVGFAAGGVMLGIAVGVMATAAAAAFPLRDIWRRGRSLRSRPRRILRGFAGGRALALTLLAALSSMGVLVARLSFTPHIAGGYAAISFGSYALPLLALTLTTVLLPRRAAAPSDLSNGRTHLLHRVAVVAALGSIGTAVLFVAPEPIVRSTFGPDYLFATAWLGPLCIAMTMFAITNVYLYRFLSLGRVDFVAVLAMALGLEIALFAFFHSAPGDLIAVLIITALVLLIGSELFERSLRHARDPVSDAAEPPPFVPLRAIEPVRDLADYGGELTIVIPAYEEASHIASTLHGTAATMEEFGCSYEILVVDDGSRDATRTISERAGGELGRVRVIGYPLNAGKGFAIVQGARAAEGDLVLFVDADLEVHPRQLQLLYRAMQEADADVVIGSKVHSEAQVDYPSKRRIMSWAYYAIVRFFFGLPVRDTQTGLKLFRKEVLDRVVPRMLVKRFAFDLEALVIAHGLGFRVVEAPVVVTRERDLPKIGWTDALHTAWDTAAVWYRTYLRRYYDKVKPASTGRSASPGKPKTG